MKSAADVRRSEHRLRRPFTHDECHDRARNEGQRPDRGYGPSRSEEIGDDAGNQRADRVAHVAPEPVDAE